MSATRARFSTDEWAHICELPSLIVAAAVSVEHAGGLGTAREIMTGLQAILDGGQLLRHNDLIQAVFEDYKEDGRGEARTLAFTERPGSILAPAACNVASNVTVVLSRDQAFAEEHLEFREWLFSLADEVVSSAANGGFLGLGGRRVSPAERAFLADLSRALQLPVAE